MVRAASLTALLLLASLGVRADEPDAKETVKRFAQAVREATTHLKSVQDAASARKAAEPLARLDQQFAAVLGQWKRLASSGQAGPPALRNGEQAIDDLETEWSRIVDTPELKGSLDRLSSLRSLVADRAEARKPGFAGALTGLAEARIDRAKVEVRTLTTAAQAYLIMQGEWPDRLEQLVKPPQGGRPYVDKEALIDPWGRPYRYDPKGPKNNGQKPDVWSIGPDANDPKGRVGNWPMKALERKP